MVQSSPHTLCSSCSSRATWHAPRCVSKKVLECNTSSLLSPLSISPLSSSSSNPLPLLPLSSLPFLPASQQRMCLGERVLVRGKGESR
ncbi:hypothetical protein ILYODFUR_024016 [Ilyodon furcidens]|uniref:Uncharacterized protein n=1 Tax=Ilyodon furcidens TaxID=33524 RepID=A0ABV0TLF8_9TELE